MLSKRNQLKAVAIVVFGLLGMRTPVRASTAKDVAGPGCIRACCFCVDSDGGICTSDPLIQDTYCFDNGCGAFVECSTDDLRCNPNQTLIECQDPNRH